MPLPSTRVVHRDRTCEVAAALDGTKPECGRIYRRVMTKSAAGGDTETLTAVATDVPFRVRVQGRRAVASSVGDQVSESAHWELSFPRGTDIAPITDRVVSDSGRTWDVLEVGSETYEPEIRALAVEVKR